MKHILIIIISMVYLSSAMAEDKCKEILDKDNIKICRRSVAGSKYDELITTAVIHARMEVVWEILCDVKSTPKWIESLEETRLIKQLDETSSLAYVAMDLPWPIANRDMVIKSVVTFDTENSRIIIRSDAVDNQIVPSRKGYVRMTESNSEWILQYIGGQRENTKVIYKFHSNPAGYIPPYFVNLFVRKQPYNTLTALKTMVKDPRFITAGEKSPIKTAIEKFLNNDQLKLKK